MKKPSDVQGYIINCIDFEPCPLCYGCRNYRTYMIKCVNRCSGNLKKDTCKTSLHTESILGRMIRRESYIIQTQEDINEL